jgi:hypothetical protein
VPVYTSPAGLADHTFYLRKPFCYFSVETNGQRFSQPNNSSDFHVFSFVVVTILKLINISFIQVLLLEWLGDSLVSFGCLLCSQKTQ